MKKIVMAATLLSIVTGGEVSALAAKTTHQSVAKITHVKVTKHKVTGYTTAKSHIKLMKLKHGEKASATANKKGKFTVKVKSNNLTKLKFKIKATKPGLKARTYTHKVKKAVQAIDNSVTTETPASTTPVKPDEGKKPEKPADKEKPHQENPQYVFVPGKPTTSSIAKLIDEIGSTRKDAQTSFDNFVNDKSNSTDGKTALNLTKDEKDSIITISKAKHILKHSPNDANATTKLSTATGNTDIYNKIKKLVTDESKEATLYQLIVTLDNANANWDKIKVAYTAANQLG